MSGWMGWFGGGRNDHKESARNAIVDLRSQLLMLEKREDHIQKQIDEETRKAKANATSNQRRECYLSALPSTRRNEVAHLDSGHGGIEEQEDERIGT